MKNKAILVIAISLFFAGVGCDALEKMRSAKKEQMNVLFISVDTLRADHLGVYGYQRNTSPNIDEFAKESVVFEKAYSHSPWTMPSVASMFTSLTPRDHGITNWMQPLEERNLTLAEYLKDNGFKTMGIVSHMIFEPKYHFNQGFEHYDYSVLDKGHPARISTSEELTDLAIDVLDDRDETPFFMWVHYFDPHNDYLLHQGFDFGKRPMDLYDSEIAFTDYHVGRLIEYIEKKGLKANTIVVFIADHGEEFHDHGGTRHSRTLYEEVLHIPLVIRIPGFKPGRVPNIIAESDVAPTLLSLLDLPIPEEFLGQPIAMANNMFVPQGNRTIYAETYRFADKRGLRQEQWKLIHDREKEVYELFDLNVDPAEKKNLFEVNSTIAEKLNALLEQYYLVKRTEVVEQEMSEKMKEDLKGLGYLN